MALLRTLLTPINDLLPRLMVKVCLVLAPDVSLFLNSRKQGINLMAQSLYLFFLGHNAAQIWQCTNLVTSLIKKGSSSCTCVIALGLPYSRRRTQRYQKLADRGS